MGKFSAFFKKLVDEDYEYDMDDYETSDYGADEYRDDFAPQETSYSDYQDVPYQSEAQTVYQQPVAVAPITPVSAATVIMLTPYDIRTSQIVCDHIREGHIVICNLTPNGNNQRVVDYISGAVFALDGKIEPTPVKTTFVCTPKNVELIVDSAAQSETGTKVSAL